MNCPTAGDRQWLEEFLAPAFQPCPGEAAIDYAADAVVDGDLYRSVLTTRPPGSLPQAVAFVLDQGVLVTEWWTDPARDGRVFADPVHEVLYLVPTGVPRTTVVAPRGGRLFRGALMRIVRELAMARAFTPTSGVLHAATVVIDGHGVLIGGPKRAGKTSLLLHLLGAPGARFVSNDRVVLGMEGDTMPVARGLPTIVTIRDDTLALFPGLARALARRRYRFYLAGSEAETENDAGSATSPYDAGVTKVSPRQLCEVLRVSMARESALGAVLLPHVHPGERGIRLRRLSPGEASDHFEGVAFAAGSRVRTSEVFRIGVEDDGADLAEARDLWSRLVHRVPAFECRIGRGGFDQRPEKLFRPLLATLEASPSPRVKPLLRS